MCGAGALARVPAATKARTDNRARLTSLSPTTRRRFLEQCAAAAAGVWLGPALAQASSAPSLQFPSRPAAANRRRFVSLPRVHRRSPSTNLATRPSNSKTSRLTSSKNSMSTRSSPGPDTFLRRDAKYLEQFRASVEKAKAAIANIAVDGEHSPYSRGPFRARAGRCFQQAVGGCRRHSRLAQHSHQYSARRKASKPDLDRTADSLQRVVEYASAKNVVVNLENDNPVSEDPFFLVKLIEKVNSPWLRTLPDFGNTLAAKDPDYAYRGIDAMFGHAYCISHVKSSETNSQGITVHVDMAKTFGYHEAARYKGYCSMEWDDAGDPYTGTTALIKTTLQYLS